MMSSVKYRNTILFFLIVFFISASNKIKYYKNYEKKIKFLNQYLNDKASQKLLVYSLKYDLDWLKVFACLMSESEGYKYAISKNKCRGYMQLAGTTARMIATILGYKHYDIFDEDFNIQAGCLFLRMILDTYTEGNEIEKWTKAIEIYNLGYGAYRKGYRNEKHIRKFWLNYTYFKIKWERFK